MLKLKLSVVACTTLLASSLLSMAPAQAQPRGRFHHNTWTSNSYSAENSSFSRSCVRGVNYGNSRGRACSTHGVNGSASHASGSAEGVGAFRRFNRTYTNSTNGNTVSGSVNSRYNSQTGVGTRTSDRSGTINGRTYDYQTDTDYHYTRGSGVSGSTTIDTLNRGTYNCTFATGSGRSCTQP